MEHAITAASETLYVPDGGYSLPYRGLRVSVGFLEGLGVRAERGRALAAPDFREAGDEPAMISARLWRERFGADPGVIGQQFRDDRKH